MRIAVVGLGLMGAAIARRIELAGHDLSVWNRSAGPSDEFVARGATQLDSPAAALQVAEIAITMVADPAAVEEVTTGPNGILTGATGGTLIDMSTISVESSERVAAEAEKRGVAFLRAPVSGNAGVVAAGNLGIIVSGSRAVFDELAPTLQDIGPNLFYVGEGERSRVVKLALNLVIGGTAELIAEALVLAEKHEIGRREMLEVMGGSAIGSPFVKYKTEPLIADDYTTTFSARLLAKDLGLALERAEDSGVPLPLTAATLELVQDCIDQGLGDGDLTVLLPRLRREAGLG
ncbi:MAG TPA: NAD(P)-dependent oxidoreductase [Gaiellaceae bacterium]|nr:NAD(P)-dependent oxidoreductase [Gaiellaceae bacterium]